MSSSRSIAAARNRRSSDPMPPPTQSRPNKSIGGQSSFVPQQQQQSRRPGQQIQQQIQQQIPQVQQPTPITKLSVSDAIGLVTLRLGRLEQFMFDVQAGAITTTPELPQNSHVYDKSVITSIVNRLDTLEKREQNNTSQTNLETELRGIKDLLLAHIIKYEKFLVENNNKIAEIDKTLDEFDAELFPTDSIGVEEPIEQLNDRIDLSSNEETTSSNIVSSDLREAIQNELANVSI